MSGAVAAIVLAAIEAEFAHRYRLAGDALRTQRHGGWAVILFALSCCLAFLSWAIG